MITYLQITKMFLDHSIYKADIFTLNECLQVMNEQPSYVEPRHDQWVSTLKALIKSRQLDGLHQLEIEHADSLHKETRDVLSSVSKDLSTVKGDVSGIKKALTKTHGLHLWILIVAILTAILALIAAVDVILKWFPNRPSDAVSEPTPARLPHSTNS
jgi:hypothetical protein